MFLRLKRPDGEVFVRPEAIQCLRSASTIENLQPREKPIEGTLVSTYRDSFHVLHTPQEIMAMIEESEK
jgi:hypothetical protein